METSGRRDLLGMTRTDQIWTFVLLGGGGALLLALLPWLLDLLSGFPIIPFRDVADWLASFDAWWAPLARIGAGSAAGVVLALVTVWDEYRLEVGDDDIVVVHGDDRRTLRREQVVGVHRDGKKVTIDGREGRVLFEHTLEADRDAVRAAFVSRHWPWESD